jgi:hypothetical protein
MSVFSIFSKMQFLWGGYGVHRSRGGQTMYFFDDLGSHLQNLTPPHVPRYSTVAMAPVVFVQWCFTAFSYQIPDARVITHTNQSLLLKHGSSPSMATSPTTCWEATIASVWCLSRTPPSQQGTNLLRRYRCFRLTFIPTPSKGTNNLSRSCSTVATVCHSSRTPSHERGLPSMYLHQTPVFIHDEEALPAPSVAASVLRSPWPPLQARRGRTCIYYLCIKYMFNIGKCFINIYTCKYAKSVVYTVAL